MRKSNIFLLV